MNQKNGRTDPGPLRERARSLFISQATIDETLECVFRQINLRVVTS